MSPRAHGDGGLHWDERRQRWIASVTLGYDGRGKRVVRKAAGRTKTEARAKLRDLLRDRAHGFPWGSDSYTVGEAVEDWLTYGLGHQGEETRKKYRTLCTKHIVPRLGARRLRDLTAREVDRWLAGLSKEMSSEPLRRTHACLNRVVRRAMARDLVSRNVVELAEVPSGLDGRQSKSLSAEQVDQVLTLTKSDRMHHYIVVSLLTGGRTD